MIMPRSEADSAEQAKGKGLALLRPEPPLSALAFSEFGTRRRRSFKAQDIVVRGLVDAQKEWKAAGGTGIGLAGTSNVSLVVSILDDDG